jgi:hypothetical protein
MKYVKMIFVLVILAVAFTSCAECDQMGSHMKSSFVGLQRHVILYANDGSIIRSWEVKGTVEDQGGSFRFLDNGKAITISGTIIIEEY